jgi:hypothetical protein
VLRSIEHRIESLFEGVFGRAFRSHVQPVEIARKLTKEMDEGRTASLARVYAPNEFHLYLCPSDREQFGGYEAGLLRELAEYLLEHARREGYALVAPPRVIMHEDADLSIGEFGIAARVVQPPQADEAPPVAPPVAAGGTRVFQPPPPPPPAPPVAAPPEPVAAPKAALVVNGISHELRNGGLVLGRSQDCDVTIDDPSASRRHAELRHDGAGWSLVDLGSTNGTEVNGKKVEQATLAFGDRITVGQTELRFERV